MLPAPQMHPGTVPVPQTFDRLSNFPGRETNGRSEGHIRRFASTHRRSFPIRISQSAQQAALPTGYLGSLTPEHNLRRKTPGGTVEAGYDGSPIQQFPGPPPLKHMILPISDGSSPYMPTDPSMGSLQRPWIQYNLHSSHNHDHLSPVHFPPPAWPYNDALSSSFDISTAFAGGPGLANISNIQPTCQHSDFYQPVIRAHEHNVRAFCPPPAPISGSLLFGHMGWHSGSSPWDNRNYEQTPRFGVTYTAPDRLQVGYGSIGDSVTQTPSIYSKNQAATGGPSHAPNNSHWSLQTYHGSHTSVPGQGPISTGESHFREKALHHSHQSYIELLSYLQANGRTSPTRANPDSFNSHKLPAYPKPPKLRGVGMIKNNGGVTAHNIPVNNIREVPSQRGRRFTLDSAGPLHRTSSYVQSAPNGSNLYLPDHKLAAMHPSVAGRPFSNMTAAPPPLPVSNALASLDILNNLCEQSEWQWLEGLLVGGCLLYSLERYDDALKWFSAITELDSR